MRRLRGILLFNLKFRITGDNEMRLKIGWAFVGPGSKWKKAVIESFPMSTPTVNIGQVVQFSLMKRRSILPYLFMVSIKDFGSRKFGIVKIPLPVNRPN